MRFVGVLPLIVCGALACQAPSSTSTVASQAPSSTSASASQAPPSASASALQAPQNPPPDQPSSLAEAAKKVRDAQASKPKASKTFDNDSMKKAPPGAPERPVTAPPASTGKSRNTAALEKAYRTKFSQLRNSLKAAETDDKRLHAEMARVGPNSAAVLHPYYDAGTVHRLQSRIDLNNKKIATLKTQLDDLADELRKKGLPAQWAE